MDLARFADTYWEGKDDRVDQARLELLLGLLRPEDRVLQVDTGPGMLLERIRKRCRSAVGTEVSAHAAERARNRGLDVTVVDTDTDPLPFPDASFDAVVSDSAAEHRYFPDRVVAEAARVLRPGGRLVLLLPNIGHWRHRLWLLAGRFPEVEGGPTDPSHIRFFTVAEGRRLVARHGLRVTAVRGFPSLWVKGLYPSVFRAPGVRAVYGLLTRLRPSVFGRDFVIVARRPESRP